MGLRQRFRGEERAFYETGAGSRSRVMRASLPWRVLPGEVPTPRKIRRLRVASILQIPSLVVMLWLGWSSFQPRPTAVLLLWSAFGIGIATYQIWVAWFRSYPYGVRADG